jgi:malonyl-CoA decarboxylase
MHAAAQYFLAAKNRSGKPLDAVARFHLGNGAILERVNWMADTSKKGLKEGMGFMVNYLYDLSAIEANHELFVNKGEIAASRYVRKLAKRPSRQKKDAVKQEVPQ